MNLGRVGTVLWQCCALTVALIVAVWLANAVSPSDLAELDIQELRAVRCKIEGQFVEIPRGRWSEVVTRIASVHSTMRIGWRGESWTYVGRLELDWGTEGVYLLTFGTRPSLGGHIVVQLSRRGLGGWWNYWHYEGADLFRWLEEDASRAGG